VLAKSDNPVYTGNMPNSWDLFDTLVAARDTTAAGDASPKDWIPIAENIARVRPDDIIISEYYLNQTRKAELAVALTGLQNRLYVTDTGKSDGSIWARVKSEKHHGDNPITDVASPQAHNIPAEHILTSKLTPAETYIAQIGLPEVALACREARLRTWHPNFRAMQLLQIDYNFPVMLVAALVLHAFAQNYNLVLMAARDCCMWVHLQKDIRDRLNAKYEIEYWPSSRFCRNKPSENYLREFNARLAKGALLVDVSGTGESIINLLSKSTHPTNPVILLNKYSKVLSTGSAPTLDTTHIMMMMSANDHILELVNVPTQGIYTDWDTTNDLDFNWNCEEIRVAHTAFAAVREAFSHYPIPIRVTWEQLSNLFDRVRPNTQQIIDFFRPALVQENKLRIEQNAGL
jgi:hypothetical protein